MCLGKNTLGWCSWVRSRREQALSSLAEKTARDPPETLSLGLFAQINGRGNRHASLINGDWSKNADKLVKRRPQANPMSNQ